MTLLGLWGRRRSAMFAAGGPRRRRWVDRVDKLLWWIPLAMIFIAGILIASTQRQADYADWYQHWITAAVGLAIALGLLFVALQLLAQAGYVEVDWTRIQRDVEPLLQQPALRNLWDRLLATLTHNLPFGASFVGGLVLGLRAG